MRNFTPGFEPTEIKGQQAPHPTPPHRVRHSLLFVCHFRLPIPLTGTFELLMTHSRFLMTDTVLRGITSASGHVFCRAKFFPLLKSASFTLSVRQNWRGLSNLLTPLPYPPALQLRCAHVGNKGMQKTQSPPIQFLFVSDETGNNPRKKGKYILWKCFPNSSNSAQQSFCSFLCFYPLILLVLSCFPPLPKFGITHFVKYLGLPIVLRVL